MLYCTNEACLSLLKPTSSGRHSTIWYLPVSCFPVAMSMEAVFFRTTCFCNQDELFTQKSGLTPRVPFLWTKSPGGCPGIVTVARIVGN